MVDVADRGKPVGERGDSVSVADENVSPRHLERVIGELSSLPEVVEHLLEITVGPGDAIVAGNGPGDVRSQELPQDSVRAACVEVVLRPVQSVEKADRGVPVHGWRQLALSYAWAGVRLPAPARQARPSCCSIDGYTIRCRNGLIAVM